MELKDLKTIDIKTLKWWDKTYGNTYFAQQIVMNYGMKDAFTLYDPFQYGYSGYDIEAMKVLSAHIANLPDRVYDVRKMGIIIRENETYTLQRDLKNIAK